MPAHKKHGHAGNRWTKEYAAWASMKARCHNPRSQGYARYGGRGITVCDRWRESFEAFLSDVGLAPSSKHSIDRIDNDGNYEPGNVRWATGTVQQFNKRTGCKVSEADVLRMQQLRSAGTTWEEIAAEFGISDTYVQDLVEGKRGPLYRRRILATQA